MAKSPMVVKKIEELVSLLNLSRDGGCTVDESIIAGGFLFDVTVHNGQGVIEVKHGPCFVVFINVEANLIRVASRTIVGKVTTYNLKANEPIPYSVIEDLLSEYKL